MYVDKVLSGIKAVQTLSRLNRAHPKKHDVFVLDFMNDTDTIQEAFADYYRTTILSEETDPNKLHDLKADLDGYQVYAATQVDELVELYLGGADRDKLDPILDACVAVYKDAARRGRAGRLQGQGQGVRRAPTASSPSILPYTNAEWEKLSIFLNFLIPKLPAPMEEDLSKGILEAIDMDSYRVEKQAAMKIQLAGRRTPRSSRCRPAAAAASRSRSWTGSRTSSRPSTTSSATSRGPTPTGCSKLITEEIPAKVAADTAYQNAMQNSDKQNARIEHDKALGARDDGVAEGRHRAVQAVQRQRVVQEVADGYGVHGDL